MASDGREAIMALYDMQDAGSVSRCVYASVYQKARGLMFFIFMFDQNGVDAFSKIVSIS